MTPRPRLLDLYCGGGGAAMGYYRAGFDVVGVDHVEQPRYPFPFVLADALAYLDDDLEAGAFDVVHASPPCQFATDYVRHGRVRESPNLLRATRDLLDATDLPYVLENVEKARPWLRDPLLVCGSMFDPPMDVQRHRLFESNVALEPPAWPCRHKLWAADRYPGGGSVRSARKAERRTGRAIAEPSRYLVRRTVEVGTWDIPVPVQARAMGIDWLTREELSEAIPPAYTQFLGEQLLERLARSAA
jgi:DNA (cytosine-5)-methyltransferase 1